MLCIKQILNSERWRDERLIRDLRTQWTTQQCFPSSTFCFGLVLPYTFQIWSWKIWQPRNAKRFRHKKLQQKPTICKQKIGKGTTYQHTKRLDNSHITTVKHHLHPCQQRPSGEPRLPPSPGCHPQIPAKVVEVVKYIAGTFIPEVW